MLSKSDRDWIEDHFSQLRELIAHNQVDIATLKVKAGVWGLLGGFISCLGLMIYIFLQ